MPMAVARDARGKRAAVRDLPGECGRASLAEVADVAAGTGAAFHPGGRGRRPAGAGGGCRDQMDARQLRCVCRRDKKPSPHETMENSHVHFRSLLGIRGEPES